MWRSSTYVEKVEFLRIFEILTRLGIVKRSFTCFNNLIAYFSGKFRQFLHSSWLQFGKKCVFIRDRFSLLSRQKTIYCQLTAAGAVLVALHSQKVMKK